MTTDTEVPESTALLTALDDYLQATEREVDLARSARDDELARVHRDHGIPVVRLAEVVGLSRAAAYKAIDRTGP